MPGFLVYIGSGHQERKFLIFILFRASEINTTHQASQLLLICGKKNGARGEACYQRSLPENKKESGRKVSTNNDLKAPILHLLTTFKNPIFIK